MKNVMRVLLGCAILFLVYGAFADPEGNMPKYLYEPNIGDQKLNAKEVSVVVLNGQRLQVDSYRSYVASSDHKQYIRLNTEGRDIVFSEDQLHQATGLSIPNFIQSLGGEGGALHKMRLSWRSANL